jgi:hypothetical protein
MRRRMGVPSSYSQTAGKNMDRMHKTSDEHYADHSAAGSARIPMGSDVYNVEAVAPEMGTLIPKKNVQAGDPVNPGSKSGRRNPVLNPGGERLGASYAPKATYATIDPAAGLTMRNARVIPSVAGRATPNFGMGIQTSQQ